MMVPQNLSQRFQESIDSFQGKFRRFIMMEMFGVSWEWALHPFFAVKQNHGICFWKDGEIDVLRSLNSHENFRFESAMFFVLMRMNATVYPLKRITLTGMIEKAQLDLFQLDVSI